MCARLWKRQPGLGCWLAGLSWRASKPNTEKHCSRSASRASNTIHNCYMCIHMCISYIYIHIYTKGDQYSAYSISGLNDGRLPPAPHRPCIDPHRRRSGRYEADGLATESEPSPDSPDTLPPSKVERLMGCGDGGPVTGHVMVVKKMGRSQPAAQQ